MGAARPSTLVLEDGTIRTGSAFGAESTVFGELVFTTEMTGYQESLTDPSYEGQLLMFTYPMIGNYGVHDDHGESDRVWARACVVQEACAVPSHHASKRTLDRFLSDEGIPGIQGIDTRELTIKTRTMGSLRAALSTDGTDAKELLAQVRAMAPPDRSNLVAAVSPPQPIRHGRNDLGQLGLEAFDEGAPNVVLVDCGAKRNIVRSLARRFNVVQVPWDADRRLVESFEPSGIFLSNGPGDPAHPDLMAKTIATARRLADDYPMMGICLGHQLVSLMFGAKTYKLKFGHRGANQPTKELATGRVHITSQNHGFAVDAKTLDGTGLELTEVNANDETPEAVRHTELPIFSAQYHPEACPGPRDTGHLFDRFADNVTAARRKR